MFRTSYASKTSSSLILVATLFCALPVQADDAPKATPSKHKMMKDCMAKQKASDGGLPKEEMKKNCRDVTATERENAKAEKASEEAENAPKN